jgi:hypothetical protein
MTDTEIREWLDHLPYKVVEKDAEGIGVTKWMTCTTDEQRVEVIVDMLNNAWTDEMCQDDVDVCVRALTMIGHEYTPPARVKWDKLSEVQSRDLIRRRQIELQAV